MGGLFSSEPEIPQRREPVTVYRDPLIESTRETRLPVYQNSNRSSYYNVYEENVVPRHSYARNLATTNFESSTTGGCHDHVSRSVTRKVQPPTIVKKNCSVLNINDDPDFDPLNVVSFIRLSEFDPYYLQIQRMVTNRHNFIIDSIEKIENPYLKKAYELKREQKRKEYPNFEERLLFHGTKHKNFNDICKFNFNWRLCKAHKYGIGVSFSPNSTYASNYSDEFLYNKVMIVAKVLIGESCLGHENMVLPDDGCDTSQKGLDAIVIVKYEDNEFYPAFKINYHLVNPNVGKGKRRGNIRNHRQRIIFS